MKKKLFVSTLAAFTAAFALAAFNPTPAQAQFGGNFGGSPFASVELPGGSFDNYWGVSFDGYNENFNHQTSTCSRGHYFVCHESIQDRVLVLADEIHQLYAPLALPLGSNGTDQAAYDWLTENIEREGEDSAYYRVRERIFPDGPASARQVTPVEPLGSLAEIMEIEAHREVTSVNREEIVELQREVNAIGNSLDFLSTNVGVVMRGIATVGEVVDENRRGIAVGYALSNVPSTLGSNSRGAISGGIGHFEDENAVAFGVTFKFTPQLTGNVAGGFDSGGGNSVSGARAGLVWEFGTINN